MAFLYVWDMKDKEPAYNKGEAKRKKNNSISAAAG